MKNRVPFRAGLARLVLVASALGASGCSTPDTGAVGVPPSIRIAPGAPRQEAPGQFSILRDPSGHLELAEVQRQRDVDWQVVPQRQISMGFTADAYWVRLRVENPSAFAITRIFESPATVDLLDLYLVSPTGAVEHQRSGKKVAISKRALSVSGTAFRIAFAPRETRAIWMRMEGRDSLAIHPVLWTEEGFANETVHKNVLASAYFGALGAMVLFNLFIWISLRDRAYLFYCVFQGTVILMFAALDGKSFCYLWPESPDWASRSEIVFTCLAFLAGVAFARAFLGTTYLPKVGDRLLRWLMGISLGVACLGLLSDHSNIQRIMLSMVVANCAVVILAGITAALKGSPNGPIFVSAWLILLVSGILSAAAYAGLWGAHLFQIEIPRVGSVAEAILFSFGLARRIKLAQHDTEAAQKMLVAHERAQAQDLERRVAERTQELSTALERLQTAQELMVKQARLASLGHLIAGVAHEVGNPLNFVMGGAAELGRRLDTLRAALPPAQRQDEVVSRSLDGALQAADLVKNGSGRIHQLIENLRAYFRVRGRERTQVDISEVVSATLALVRPLLKQQEIAVTCEFQELAPVASLPGELSQVFLNLILNACQAMPTGGTLRIRTCASGLNRIDVIISDTGGGVAREHRDSVFDPFFTTRPGEGTGLGLSVSLRIVEAHHGELRLVDSDQGATFVVSLPIDGPTDLAAP